MKKITWIFLACFSMALFSCEDLLSDPNTGDEDDGDEEIANGLKEALRVGTDTAVSFLAVTDGYFKDEAVKILLPDDLEVAIANLKSKTLTVNLPFPLSDIEVTGEQIYQGYNGNGISIPGLQAKEDLLIEGLNRAAEKACEEAKPIFVDIITNMTVTDALDILFGEDTAATHYLESNSRTSLFTNYEPKIDAALNSVQIGGLSVAEVYEDYIGTYNDVVGTQVLTAGSVGDLIGVNTIAAEDISEHATNKGLDGLFLKVADQEKNIRLDPLARVTDLLVKVFGKLDL